MDETQLTLKHVDARIDLLDSRMVTISERIGCLYERFDVMDEWFTLLNDRLGMLINTLTHKYVFYSHQPLIYNLTYINQLE